MGLDEGVKKEFTPEFGRIVEIAFQESRRLRHYYVGTEHLLLALVHYKEEPVQTLAGTPLDVSGLVKSQIENIVGEFGYVTPSVPEVYRLLSDYNVSPEKLKKSLEFVLDRGGNRSVPTEEIRFTPRGATAIKHAYEGYAADREPRLPVGIHILYGLLREGEGIAAGVLESLGVTLEKLQPLARKYRPKPT